MNINMDHVKRLEEIAALKDGWFGPNSERPSQKAVEAARQALGFFQPGFFFAPAECGTICFEWEYGPLSVFADVSPDGVWEIVAIDLSNPGADEREETADTVEDAAEIVRRFIGRMLH